MPSENSFCKYQTQTEYCIAQGGHTGKHELRQKLYSGPGEATPNVVPPTIQRPQLSAEQVREAASYVTLRLPGKLNWDTSERTEHGKILHRLLSASLLTGEKVPPVIVAGQSDVALAHSAFLNQPFAPAAPPVLQALGICDLGGETLHEKHDYCENWRALADSPVSGRQE